MEPSGRNDFVIEDGVRPSRSGLGRTGMYPFGKLKVDQSFVVYGNGVSARRSAYAYGKRHGLQFKTEKQPDGTVRVWRTA